MYKLLILLMLAGCNNYEAMQSHHQTQDSQAHNLTPNLYDEIKKLHKNNSDEYNNNMTRLLKENGIN